MFGYKMDKPITGANQHTFAAVPKADIQRSSFKRNFNYKTTFNSGFLIPFYVDEALPGDTFNLKVSTLARLATPLKPIMDNMYLDIQFFAVPYRLVWDNWEKMNGAQDNPGDSVDFVVPQIVAPAVTGWASLGLEDYFGLPTAVPGLSVSSLWHRAYNLIWNTWYRDQNIQQSLHVEKGNGPDTASWYALRRRGKRHDYFTSCLPSPQKGAAVTFGMGGTAPVLYNTPTSGATEGRFILSSNTAGSTPTEFDSFGGSYPTDSVQLRNTAATIRALGYNPGDTLKANLSAATAITVNAFREAVQLQRILERDARGGTRYVEMIKAHFGVVSPDFRLQRPEYLGGGSTNINVSAIPQTSASGAAGNLGDLAAFGTAMGNMNGFSKSFVEHCLIIGLMSVRADLTYQQGIPRMFSRRTRYDFAMPATCHLGEQAVLNKEIFADGSVADNAAFGYQERFGEYRYGQSKITGKFRSNDAQTLDVWHLAQEFNNLPTLSPQFIEENPPLQRCIAVQTEPEFLFDSYFVCDTARPMPLYGVPGLVDHF